MRSDAVVNNTVSSLDQHVTSKIKNGGGTEIGTIHGHYTLQTANSNNLTMGFTLCAASH